MRISKTILTPGLKLRLREAGDVGRKLNVKQDGEDITVCGPYGDEPLTVHENTRITGILAAHSVEAF